MFNKPLTLSLNTVTVVRLLELATLGLLLVTAILAWQATNADAALLRVQPIVDQRYAELEQQQMQVNTLPALQLNQDNQRQGPEVIADPSGVGKENPFK